MSATNAVIPPISIGHGCRNKATDAMNDTKETEVRTFATGIVNEKDSLTIPKMINAANAFQNLYGKVAGMPQSLDARDARTADARTASVAADTATM